MGDAGNGALRLKFDSSLKLEFHGAKITSDAGLLAYRELDEQFGLTRAAANKLVDTRRGKNTQHSMLALLRQAVYGRVAGYEDTNDAQYLRVDPAMRRVVGGRAEKKLAASSSQMGRFETEFLPTQQNVRVLSSLCGAWIDRVHRRTGLCAGLQPGELSEAACPASQYQALVADDAAREADQDRSQSCYSCPVRDLPDGGGGRATMALSDHP